MKRHSDRLAIKSGLCQLTYSELDQASNHLAQGILAQQGQGPEPIALLFEHGAPVIVAILAVLKAGKFYVPLDSSYPPDRLRAMLEDSQATMILTNGLNLALAGNLVPEGCQLLNIDQLDPALSTGPRDPCLERASPRPAEYETAQRPPLPWGEVALFEVVRKRVGISSVPDGDTVTASEPSGISYNSRALSGSIPLIW